MVMDHNHPQLGDGQLRESGSAVRERELRARSLARFAAGMAHDLNNALTIIGGNADLLLDAVSPGNPLHSEIVEIRKAADKLKEYAQRLQAIGERQGLRPGRLRADQWLRDIREHLQRAAGSSIEINIAPEDVVPTAAANAGPRSESEKNDAEIAADPDQLELAFQLILSSSKSAIGDSGRIEISARNVNEADAKWVELTVRDSGPPWEERQQELAGEPFTSSRRGERGSGLSLAAARGIVRQSGGEVYIGNENGRAIVRMRFRASTSSAEVPRIAEEPAHAKPDGATVLLVEDEEGVRWLARTVLQLNGYRVLDARSGEEALEIIERNPSIDLLLTDVIMPHMSGRELAERVARIHPGTQVLFMSGFGDTALVRRQGDDRAAFLQKPFTGESLTRKVKEVLTQGHQPGTG
jgi:two-component system cell cycle sensor histidine kinase/response regulator CckA